MNNIKEQWTRWNPANNLAKKYYLDSIFDNIAELKITLLEENNKKNKVIITFKYPASSYRETKKIFKDKLIYDLNQKYGKNFCDEWAFFKVDNSNYIKWLSEQSCGIYDDVPFVHYSLITTNSILDLIDQWEPKIEIIKE